MRTMKDTKEDDVLPFNTVKELVGEAVRQDAAEAAIVNGVPFGVGFQPQQCLSLRSQKFIAQARTLAFIPVVRAEEVSLGLGPDANRPVHR